VASGEGVLTGAAATTAAGGIATVGSWTLGTAAGANTLTATIAGSDPSISVTFTAMAAPIPPSGLRFEDAALTAPYGAGGLTDAPTLDDNGGEGVRYQITAPETVPGGITIDESTGVLRWSEALDAGTYELTVGASNRAGTATAALTITITPIAVTVIPDADQLKVVGAEDPIFMYTLSEPVPEALMTGALGRVPGEGPGRYPYLIGTLSAGPNYALAVQEGEPRFWITQPEIRTETVLSDARPALGDTITVRVRIESTGGVAVENLELQVTPDAPRLRVLTWRVEVGTLDLETWTWRLPRLAPGEVVTIELEAVVIEGVDGGGG
jgi:hypothetical protein